jgi:hypothetical protein
MENLGLEQLQLLLFVVFGLIILIVIVLVAYVATAWRRPKARRKPSSTTSRAVRADQRQSAQVLSLIQEEPGAPLLVEMGGARYRRLDEVHDPERKRQVVALAMEMIKFTGVLAQGGIAPAPLEKTETWREDLRTESHSELELARAAAEAGGQVESTEEIEEQFLQLIEEMGPEPALEPPSVIEAVRQRLAPKTTEPMQQRTFVDDIEDIIQRRAPLIPALAGRGLHVQPGESGRVYFTFDGVRYDNVEDIPNTTARQLVHDAIKEWEETV